MLAGVDIRYGSLHQIVKDVPSCFSPRVNEMGAWADHVIV